MEEEAVLKEEEVLVFVDSLGASSVVIGTRSWVKTEGVLADEMEAARKN